MMNTQRLKLGALLTVWLSLSLSSVWSQADTLQEQQMQKKAQVAVHNIIDPIVDRYCPKMCKVTAITVDIEYASKDSLAPGFDEDAVAKAKQIEIESARIKILFDEKIASSSKSEIINLMNHSLEGLDFPVTVEAVQSRFPITKDVESKVNEAKGRIVNKFVNILDEIVHQFCAGKCMVTDVNLKTDMASQDDSTTGMLTNGIIDADVPLVITDISATLLFDESMSPQDQRTIIEMAQFKTAMFKNVSLIPKVIRFPSLAHEAGLGAGAATGTAAGALAGSENGQLQTNRVLNSEESKQQKIASESKLSQTEKNLQENKLTQTQTQTQKEETKSTQTSENDVKQNLSQNSSEKSDRVEHFERIEKVERVESGDAVQKELGRIKIFGLLFCAALIALLVFIAMAVLRAPAENRVILENLKKGGPASLSAFGGTEQGMNALESSSSSSKGNDETIGKRLEIQRLTEELLGIFIQNPKVTKIVFSNILMDDGIEVAAKYLKIFGEHVFLELLRDASIQREMNDLVAFYARATVEFDMDEELSLLRKLHSKTISGKITASVASSTLIFDFLSEMDANQVEELMRGESDDIKAIVLTQCDNQKRSRIFAQMDSASRMAVMAKLSHIDYLPKNYIYNVAMALKRKKTDNPKLNTESLPGSEVLLSLLETTGQDLQRAVVKNLELQNMDNTRVLMNKLVSIDTLRYLRDGQILEVILSLKHDELLFFLKGCGEEIRKKVFSKAPGDLVADLEEELESVKTVSKEAYQLVERKVINKIKVMSHEGQINLLETNERMFSEADRNASGFVNASAPGPQ